MAVVALAACNASTTEDPVPPVTGIRIDTLSLFGVDSCGPSDTQIAKSVVTLRRVERTDAGEVIVQAARYGVFDCFTDPAFTEPFALEAEYKLRVYAFSAQGYEKHALDIKSAFAPDAGVGADEGLADLASVVATCTAFEYENVSSTAVCQIERDGRITDAGAADATGTDSATDASSDASPADAGGDAGASDAGAADAGDAGDGGS